MRLLRMTTLRLTNRLAGLLHRVIVRLVPDDDIADEVGEHHLVYGRYGVNCSLCGPTTIIIISGSLHCINDL